LLVPDASIAEGILACIPDAVAIVRDGRAVYINAAFTHLFGYAAEELSTIQLLRVMMPEVRQGEDTRMEREVDKHGRAAIETVRLAKSGAALDVSLQVASLVVKGASSGYIFSFRDISDRKLAEASLEHHAMHDPLTGLPNRALFLDRLTHALTRRVRRRDQTCAVLFLDLDRFKPINDTMGHAAGDVLLASVAKRLSNALRPQDTAARLGGDEFAVLLENILSVADLETVTSRILHEMDQPHEVFGRFVHASVSIGAAMAGVEYSAPELLIRDADFAMYRAKQQGGSRFEIFDSKLKVQAANMEERERELRTLLDKRSFEFWYQPIFRIENGKVEGFESQLRWRKEDGSVVSNNDLRSVAEETGLSISLGRETVESVCRQLRSWMDAAPSLDVTLTIPITQTQFHQSELVSQLKRALAATGADSTRLLVEVQETTLNENPTVTASIMQRMADCNVRLAVANFGSSLAPLNYLAQLPIDVVMLDASLTKAATSTGRQRTMLESLLQLCRELRIQVIAQGIDTSDQLAALQSIDCELGLGSLFSAALPASQALNLAGSKRA
jgi:Amt family ammonium transporter